VIARAALVLAAHAEQACGVEALVVKILTALR
jgi:hypothetical protein